MPWWANEILFPYNDKMQKFQGWSSRFIQIIFANIVIVVLLRSKFNNDWLLNHINPQGAIIDYELDYIHKLHIWNFRTITSDIFELKSMVM